MDQHLHRSVAARALVTAFVATALALIVLAVADTVTPYGWKVFVLTKIFKIGWAASVAFAIGLVVQEFLAQVVGGGRSEVETRAVRWVMALAAFSASLIVLCYLMPDWYPWSELIAGIFLAGWAAIAALIRAAS